MLLVCLVSLSDIDAPMTYIEFFEISKNIVLAVAAAIGAYVAFKGLGTWQRQLKGQFEYELSRRILVSLFKYRDAINGVRNPVMWGGEMPVPPSEERGKMDYEQIKFYGLSKTYQARWDKVTEQRSALHADLLEAEATWGKELNPKFENIFKLENELVRAVSQHLRISNPATSDQLRESISRSISNRRDILYDESYESPDDYKKDFLNAVSEVETYLKTKLKHV